MPPGFDLRLSEYKARMLTTTQPRPKVLELSHSRKFSVRTLSVWTFFSWRPFSASLFFYGSRPRRQQQRYSEPTPPHPTPRPHPSSLSNIKRSFLFWRFFSREIKTGTVSFSYGNFTSLLDLASPSHFLGRGAHIIKLNGLVIRALRKLVYFIIKASMTVLV